MTEPQMDVAAAAEVLGVDHDRIQAMVDQDLLHPVDGAGAAAKFDAAEVHALANLGG